MHNLLTNANGETAFVAAGKPAWHLLGKFYGDTDGITVDQALEDIGAGEIVTAPLAGTFMGPDLLPTEVTMPGVKGTFRSRPDGTLLPLGVVGEKYKVIQEHEGWHFLYEVIRQTGAHVSAAGLLGNGARSFLALKLPDSVTVGGVDTVDRYLFCDTSHDGRVKYTVGGTHIRVECANTLALARATTPTKYEVGHTANARLDAEKARELLNVTGKYDAEWRQTAETLFRTPVNYAQYERLLTDAYGPGEDASKDALRVWDRKIDTLRNLWWSPSNAGLPSSAWRAFNALDEYLDWSVQTRGVSGREADARRFEQALSGQRDAVKRGFKDRLLALAG